jgi:hypothetical protein
MSIKELKSRDFPRSLAQRRKWHKGREFISGRSQPGPRCSGTLADFVDERFVLSDVTDPIEAIRNARLLEWLLPQQAVGN